MQQKENLDNGRRALPNEDLPGFKGMMIILFCAGEQNDLGNLDEPSSRGKKALPHNPEEKSNPAHIRVK